MKLLKYVYGFRNYSKGTKKLTVSFEERNEILKNLRRELQYPLLTARKEGISTARVKKLVSDFKTIEHTPVPDTPEFEVRGRVSAVRVASKGLMFLDVQEGDSQMQVVMNAKKLANPLSEIEQKLHSLIRRGDSVSIVGRPWRTKAGELSLLSSMSVKLLSPSLHPLPEPSASKTIRKHNRVAELKAFEEARHVLKARDSIILYLSEFLRGNDFLQVQTPHLSTQRGGANAKSFQTFMEDKTELYLRVAPELWLKRLIVGGFDRVFEIGNSYRNEGIDSTHNPEFTTCEFYMTFASLDDLIDLTKKSLVYISKKLALEFPMYAANCSIFSDEKKWRVIDFVGELEKATQHPLKLEKGYLDTLCKNAGIGTESADDIAHLLDKLASHYIEPQCISPTFIVNHPSIMAPLAKESQKSGLKVSRRFEFYVGKREYINAYEEENDPQVQFEKLRMQNKNVPDISFVEALEWGLPPTGGWGLGVDRLVMLLTGCNRIADVLAFGDLTQKEIKVLFIVFTKSNPHILRAWVGAFEIYAAFFLMEEMSVFAPPSLPKADKTKTFTYHHDPEATKKEPVIVGVDEAGRGPVLGPMVYAAAYVPLSYTEELKTHGYNDSKVLNADVRLRLFKDVLQSPKQDNIGWATTVMTASDIGEGMLRPDLPYNLNDQAHDTTMALVKLILDSGTEIAALYVDTVGPPDKYQQKLARNFPSIKEINVAKKADSLYPIVSLASICAKVTRDLSLEDQLDTACGSGYPSDPNTVAWLKSNMDRLFGWGPLVRYSWGTAKNMLEKDGIEIVWKSEREEADARKRVLLGLNEKKTSNKLPKLGMKFFGEPLS